MSSVLQDWVAQMPWKCQSILLSGLRGTDGNQPPAIKAVSRWLRSVAQHNADPSKGYMQADALPEPLALCAELEYQTCHYVHHLADALRTVEIWHPDEAASMRAAEYHYRIAEELFHFKPETDTQFVTRHRDKAEQTALEREAVTAADVGPRAPGTPAARPPPAEQPVCLSFASHPVCILLCAHCLNRYDAHAKLPTADAGRPAVQP